MDHIGWQVAGGLLVAIVSWILGRVMAPQNDCEKCGIKDLKAGIDQLKSEIARLASNAEIERLNREITRLSNLLRVLADKVQLSAKEQIEIEAME